MNIGLFGFSFEDRNKGCEALTYSFISILNELVPSNLTIINLSGIGGCEELKKKFPRISFEVTGFQRRKIGIDSFKKLLKCDVIFDCTFGDNFSDIYSRSFVSKTTLLKEMTLLFHKPLVLAPQTIGPFKDAKLMNRVIRVLRKSDIVFARDVLSTDYVKKISDVDAITTTDLAFLLPYLPKEKTGNVTRIGINVSGLLWKGGFESDNQFGLTVDYKQYIERIVHEIQKDKNFEIHFIPHVVTLDENEIDNDYYICEKLSKSNNGYFSGFFSNPIDAKSYISNMDVFIGARMHSTVAAFSSGVVTIPFSYSRKFEGLFETIGYSYLIDGKTLSTEAAINKTLELIKNTDSLKLSQKNALEVVYEYEEVFVSRLKDYLSSIIK